MMIFDLLLPDSKGLNLMAVIRIYGNILGLYVFSIALPIHTRQEIRVWKSSCIPRSVMSDLFIYIGRNLLEALMIVGFE